MPKRSSRDLNQAAFRVVQIACRGASGEEEVPEIIKLVMQEMGRRGGMKGGKARAAKLSSERRSEIAKTAAAARWKRK